MKFLKGICWCILWVLFFTQGFFLETMAQKTTETNTATSTNGTTDNAWMNISTDCMVNGTCSFSINEITQVKQWSDNSPMTLIQDIILWATTFIGTVVTVTLIVSWLYYVFSWANASHKDKAKKGILYSIVGLVVVMLALVIIRLVQFLARGWS